MTDIKRRDYFAAKAMQELLQRFDPDKYPIAYIVKDAYAIADAMILESSK